MAMENSPKKTADKAEQSKTVQGGLSKPKGQTTKSRHARRSPKPREQAEGMGTAIRWSKSGGQPQCQWWG